MAEQTEPRNPRNSLTGDVFCDPSSNDTTNYLVSTTSISNLTAIQYEQLLSFLNCEKVSGSVNFASNTTPLLTPNSSLAAPGH